MRSPHLRADRRAERGTTAASLSVDEVWARFCLPSTRSIRIPSLSSSALRFHHLIPRLCTRADQDRHHSQPEPSPLPLAAPRRADRPGFRCRLLCCQRARQACPPRWGRWHRRWLQRWAGRSRAPGLVSWTRSSCPFVSSYTALLRCSLVVVAEIGRRPGRASEGRH